MPNYFFCKNTHYLHDVTIFIDYNTGNIKNIIFNGIHMTHITNLDYYIYESMKCSIKVDKIVTIVEKYVGARSRVNMLTHTYGVGLCILLIFFFLSSALYTSTI